MADCLRVITHLVPGFPINLYQTFQYYLEETLNIPVVLMVESRWNIQNGKDPLSANIADIAFMKTCQYLQLSDQSSIELLPFAPMYNHPRSNNEPVYFADVIVHADNAEKFKDFTDLKGFRWGYSDDLSICSSVRTQEELRKLATDMSFFAETVRTGSDIASIEQLLYHQLHATAVDTNSLQAFLREHPVYKDKLHVLCTWGPFPVQPIVARKDLNDKLKEAIVQAFMNMNTSPKWQEQLAKYNITGFKANSSLAYSEIKLALEQNKHKAISTKAVYY